MPTVAAVHAWLESRHFQAGLIPVKILAIPLFATGTGILSVQLRAAMEARQPLPPWELGPGAIRTYVLDPARHRPWLDVQDVREALADPHRVWRAGRGLADPGIRGRDHPGAYAR